ncbi:3-hydroxyacyl-CoA dehydrogenase family protein [Rhodococcus erythropolis]|nr:3-hydroxyacyl-CoA dehydrogenase family protein [Rhodococcus erythropolis]
MDIGRVGVIGAGTIGRGVAQTCAQAGFDVRLVDIAQGQLDNALAQIERDLPMHSMLRGQQLSERVGVILSRITVDTKLNALTDTDFVVENVTEDWAVKRDIYQQINTLCRPDVIFAVNTSAVPITRIGSATTRPGNVVGLHFMNPVPLMDTVEVMRGHYTSPQTLETSLGLLAKLGKEGIVVEDSPGFVTNRVLMLTINEAIFCVQDGVASAEQVDQIFRGCFGHKMGPLETGDLIGLDTILNSITVLYESYRDSKYRPAPLLVKMVDAGRLGCKSKHGFYDY